MDRKRAHKYIHQFRKKYDQTHRVQFQWASSDAEYARYLKATSAVGSTAMDLDGSIYVGIDDTAPDYKAALLEELAHAIQFMSLGNISLAVNDSGRADREAKVATCLLEKHEKLGLSDEEVRECRLAQAYYEE